MSTPRKRTQDRLRPLTLALIGAGRWGTNIRRTMERLPNCHLKYVETEAWRRLLRVDDIDGTLIATPASTHARIALPFITRGIPTFIEKPMTTSVRDALRLQRAARTSGALVFVGHVHLYNPAYETAKRYAQRAGQIRYIYAEGMNNGPFRDDISCLWDWAPHDLALALDLLRREPKTVQAWGVSLLHPRKRIHDVALLHLLFPDGVEFFGTYSWLAPEKRKRFTVVGTRYTIVLDDVAKHKVTVYQDLGPQIRGRTVRPRKPMIRHQPYRTEPALERELAAFLHMIRVGSPPPSDLAQGIATIRILEAAERSLANGGTAVPYAAVSPGVRA